MGKFMAGDLVERADGGTFSNGELTVTVDRVEDQNVIWLKETATHTQPSYLKLVKRRLTSIDDAIAVLNARLNELKMDADRIEKAISVLKEV